MNYETKNLYGKPVGTPGWIFNEESRNFTSKVDGDYTSSFDDKWLNLNYTNLVKWNEEFRDYGISIFIWQQEFNNNQPNNSYFIRYTRETYKNLTFGNKTLAGGTVVKANYSSSLCLYLSSETDKAFDSYENEITKFIKCIFMSDDVFELLDVLKNCDYCVVYGKGKKEKFNNIMHGLKEFRRIGREISQITEHLNYASCEYVAHSQFSDQVFPHDKTINSYDAAKYSFGETNSANCKDTITQKIHGQDKISITNHKVEKLKTEIGIDSYHGLQENKPDTIIDIGSPSNENLNNFSKDTSELCVDARQIKKLEVCGKITACKNYEKQPSSINNMKVFVNHERKVLEVKDSKENTASITNLLPDIAPVHHKFVSKENDKIENEEHMQNVAKSMIGSTEEDFKIQTVQSPHTKKIKTNSILYGTTDINISTIHENGYKKVHIGCSNCDCKENGKVILLLGATGSGKTTLLNFIANFYFGAQTAHEHIIFIDNCNTKTELISLYTFHKEGADIITVIDTPGLNDSSGVEITDNVDSLRSFLALTCSQGLQIHAIGFVVQAHLVRLTSSEQRVIDYVRTIFGTISDSHIITLVSFSDNQPKPPVIEAIEVYGIKEPFFVKFNNTLISSSLEIDALDKMYWRLGLKSWKKCIKYIQTMNVIPNKTIAKMKKEVFKKSVLNEQVSILFNEMKLMFDLWQKKPLKSFPDALKDQRKKLWIVLTAVFNLRNVSQTTSKEQYFLDICDKKMPSHDSILALFLLFDSETAFKCSLTSIISSYDTTSCMLLHCQPRADSVKSYDSLCVNCLNCDTLEYFEQNINYKSKFVEFHCIKCWKDTNCKVSLGNSIEVPIVFNLKTKMIKMRLKHITDLLQKFNLKSISPNLVLEFIRVGA